WRQLEALRRLLGLGRNDVAVPSPPGRAHRAGLLENGLLRAEAGTATGLGDARVHLARITFVLRKVPAEALGVARGTLCPIHLIPLEQRVGLFEQQLSLSLAHASNVAAGLLRLLSYLLQIAVLRDEGFHLCGGIFLRPVRDVHDLGLADQAR